MIILTILLLALMEVSLSFDNAVINAGVLKDMSTKWQNRFLTWGIAVAVFGMRLVFPVVIVAVAGHLPMDKVVSMAVHDPVAYAAALAAHHINISAFGGMFLLMVFIEFVCDSSKEVHWLGWVERRLANLGLLKGSEVIIATTTLVIVQSFIHDPSTQLSCLLSGFLGIGLYMLLQAVMGICDLEEGAANIAKRGLSAFIYLEVLDASCSLDGVIGAFVLTNNILLIMIGLGIGAFAIRSLTLYLVRGGTLKEYIYLEHGAHWGIGALAAIMLTDIFYPVPEPITGMVGMSFIGLSLLSSIRHRKQLA